MGVEGCVPLCLIWHARAACAGYKVKDGSEGVTARKSVQLWALPRVLVLHLKRFSYGLTGTGKIHKPIAYGDRLR